MAMKADRIIQLIKEAFPDAIIDLQDLQGDQDHYAITITSKDFEGKNRIQQHQMVYNAFQGRMGTELHALSLKTKVPSP